MASTAVSNPAANNSDRSLLRRKKKKKIPNQNQNLRNQAQAAQTEWKSDTQQQAYSSKLLQALRRVRITGGAAPKGGRAVREAADRVLAVAAKGRTRWSRAILTNRIKLKFMKNSASHKRQRVTVTTGNSRRQKKPRVSILRLKTKNLPAFQRKASVLGRLVPGCRKQPLPVILEEATDYIAALEMQVRAMTALTQLLSGASSSSSSSSASSSSSSSVNALNQLGSSRHPPAS
ncbi:transcription factor bHLH148-like [Coffea eugenioides]|uniref:transcription factor bHLH148-like n=1 Tax=Coffea eugenioides TaxID=49369 RepID=UPI000F609377|nr:transcription factor bHLH148-like [Coffea eugenioides]XP_027165582.1 transcription factor bHLH148-like [Coffea eugenioides]XP_027165583.1 transcription factor bHLH148-like [Coffea eugenioides]